MTETENDLMVRLYNNFVNFRC